MGGLLLGRVKTLQIVGAGDFMCASLASQCLMISQCHVGPLTYNVIGDIATCIYYESTVRSLVMKLSNLPLEGVIG